MGCRGALPPLLWQQGPGLPPPLCLAGRSFGRLPEGRNSGDPTGSAGSQKGPDWHDPSGLGRCSGARVICGGESWGAGVSGARGWPACRVHRPPQKCPQQLPAPFPPGGSEGEVTPCVTPQTDWHVRPAEAAGPPRPCPGRPRVRCAGLQSMVGPLTPQARPGFIQWAASGLCSHHRPSPQSLRLPRTFEVPGPLCSGPHGSPGHGPTVQVPPILYLIVPVAPEHRRGAITTAQQTPPPTGRAPRLR